MQQLRLTNFSKYNFSDIIETNSGLIESLYWLDESKKVSIYANLAVILIGLLGNLLTITIFIQKRFRTNSSHVFLLWLAVNDSLYLMIHLFEDILQKYEDIYLPNRFISMLNVVHKSDLDCRFVH